MAIPSRVFEGGDCTQNLVVQIGAVRQRAGLGRLVGAEFDVELLEMASW
jgi:hypothetical protein